MSQSSQQQSPAAPRSAVLPVEDASFAALVEACRFSAASRVELRIHEKLCRRELDSPIQFGVFALEDIAAGQEITPYGGILRSEQDYKPLADPSAKSHARKLHSGFVLDGLPLANMLDRPIPSQVHGGLDALLNEGMQPRLPSSSRYAASDLKRFTSTGIGFMANTERLYLDQPPLSPANVNITKRTVKIAGMSYQVPILSAARLIRAGEEIISPYGRPASASPPPPAAAAAAAAASSSSSLAATAAVASPSATAAAAASSSSFRAATAASRTPASHSSVHMKKFQWVLIPPSDKSIAAATAWLQWANQQSASGWQEQRGKWQQLNANDLESDIDGEQLWELGYEAGKSFLLCSLLSDGYSLRLFSQKLLRSFPGDGLQNDHCDAATFDEATGCYSVLIYLTEGESTAVPDTPYDARAERICWEMSPTSAKQNRIHTATHPVQVGAGMVISHKVVHYAPCNNTQQPRLVLFQHWLPPSRQLNPPDPDLQRLPYGLQLQD